MSFRYTPTPTPSNTPTTSLTPSITPTITPTETVCPGLTPTSTSSPYPTTTPTGTPTGTPGLSPTQTPTQTNTPSSEPTGGELIVYAKYTDTENVLQYQINYGTYETIGNIDSLTCQYFYTITGLTTGDVIYFTTTSFCVLAMDTSSPCPNSGFSCSQTYNFLGGTNYAYITVDGSNCC